MDKIYIEITDIIQKMFDEHRVKIDKILIDWIDISTLGQANFTIKEIKLTSSVTRKVVPESLMR